MKADNDRIRGRQQVHLRLGAEVETDAEGVETAREPRIAIFRRDDQGNVGVRRWWEEIQSLRESEKNPEDVETDQPDEGYDTFRYFCMSRPIIPKVPRHAPPPGSFKAIRDRHIKAKAYARRHGVSMAQAFGMVR